MKKCYKHKTLSLKGYNMIYLAASPFISNITIYFITVNQTLICFKRERQRERECIRLFTGIKTFCTTSPRFTQCRRAVSWGTYCRLAHLLSIQMLQTTTLNISHIQDSTYHMLQKALPEPVPTHLLHEQIAKLDLPCDGSCKTPWVSLALAAGNTASPSWPWVAE